jgi:hypothetical protein
MTPAHIGWLITSVTMLFLLVAERRQARRRRIAMRLRP